MTKSFATMVLVAATLFISTTAQASVGFDFAADTQGWAAEDWGDGTPTLSWTDWSGGTLQSDTHAMDVGPEPDGNWAKAYLKRDLSSAVDLTSTPIYSLDIYIPWDMYNITAKLGVRTGSGATLYLGNATSELIRGSWQTLTWDMAGTTNLNDVRQLGVQIEGWYPPSPGGTTFNIDNVSANAAPVPEPASLLLLGTGLVGIFALKNRKARG